MAGEIATTLTAPRPVARRYTGWVVLGLVLITFALFGASSGLLNAADKYAAGRAICSACSPCTSANR